MKIYVASSWRNGEQPMVVRWLTGLGHEVYDFKHSVAIFKWDEIDPQWKTWTPRQCIDGLKHDIAHEAFHVDMDAMEWADVFVGVQPFGRSASIEMGWAAGRGKPTVLFMRSGDPELMVNMFGYLVGDYPQLRDAMEMIEIESKDMT